MESCCMRRPVCQKAHKQPANRLKDISSVCFRYIVSNVMEYKTPQSHFDSESYHTYADYYASKYNLEIMGPKDQPLLEVCTSIYSYSIRGR